jgi:hypothetical protein
MNSTVRIKSLARQLASLSAGLLLHFNPLFAAAVASDPQTLARDLLTGTGRSVTVDASPARSSDDNYRSSMDPQDLARRLILGPANVAGIADEAAAFVTSSKEERTESARDPAYSDPQNSARQMILGEEASERTPSRVQIDTSVGDGPVLRRGKSS